MPRDLFEENGIKPNDPKDLFQQNGISFNDNTTSKEEPGFFKKLLPNVIEGLAEGGHQTINLPSNIARFIKSQGGDILGFPIPNPEKYRQKDYDFAEMLGLPKNENATLSDKLVRGLSQYLPEILSPELGLGSTGEAIKSIPYVGRMIKKSIGNAIPVATYNAIQNPEEAKTSAIEGSASTLPFSAISTALTSSNPLVRNFGRLGVGGLGAYIGHKGSESLGMSPWEQNLATVGGGALGLIGKSPLRSAKENVLEGVEETNYPEKLEAAKKLGLSYITPAEASGSPFVGAQQGAVGKTEQGSKLLYKKSQERLQSEKNSINNLFHTIYDKEKLDPEVASLYKKSYEKEIPQEFVDNLKENDIFKTAIRNMKSKPAFKQSLKGVPENSIGYLDHVKQSLDDMIEAAPKKEARLLKQTRSELVNKMDEMSPEYPQARSLAERGILRNKLEESLNKKDVRGTNFYNKILKNDKNFNKTLFSLRHVPEAQEKLKDMRMVFGDLINPPTVRTAAGLANTGMRQERNTSIALYNKFINSLTGGGYDKAAINMITSPKWAEELKEINKLPGYRQKLSKLVNLLGRASGVSAGSSYNNQGNQ